MTITSQDPFDVFWFQDDYRPFEVPLFFGEEDRFDEYQMDISQPTEYPDSKTETQKPQQQLFQENSEDQSVKTAQSDLHNCPKHLIKFITQCLNLQNSQITDCDEFKQIEQPVRKCIKNLIGILDQCSKGKIKSFSKELLKIIFQEGSQKLSKLKLLQNSYIKKVFTGADSVDMNRAKCILREFTIERLMKEKSDFVDRSRIVRKGVNERYLQVFVGQLKNGKVKQRVSKQDKEWILQIKNF